MPDITIRVDHLNKLYPIGRAQQRHDTTSILRRCSEPALNAVKGQAVLSASLRDALVND